jgi:putative membrane protein
VQRSAQCFADAEPFSFPFVFNALAGLGVAMTDVFNDALPVRQVSKRSVILFSAVLALAAGLLALSTYWPEQQPLTRHMLQHAVTMNVIAPALALLWHSRTAASAFSGLATLVAATLAQIGLLWAWHLPGPLMLAHSQSPIMAAMHASLFVAALTFWRSIIASARLYPVRAVLALLITGKLYCLYAILLIFADRALFAHAGHAHHVITLPDQQLAGLIMVSACPLTYVAAAIAVAARWIYSLERSVGGART